MPDPWIEYKIQNIRKRLDSVEVHTDPEQFRAIRALLAQVETDVINLELELEKD
jgi:hypothetical protein